MDWYHGAYVTAAVRCAPPENKPTPEERDNCRPFIERELALLAESKVFVALGQFGYQVVIQFSEYVRDPNLVMELWCR